MAQQVADAPSLGASAKMEMLLAGSHIGGEVTNVQTILKLSPVFAQIVEQGNAERVFSVDRPLETIQFLLASSQILLDGGLFEFSETEITQRRLSMQGMIEKSLGAASGNFGFMNPPTS